MRWIKATERMPEDDDEVYVLRREVNGRWNMDIVGLLKTKSYSTFVLVDQEKPIVPKEDLHFFEWLDQSAEAYPDTDAGGWVFCGKCGKTK